MPSHRRIPIRRRPAPRNTAGRPRGYVLIEVLVAGLVFSIGVLGIVSLQAKMTQSQTVGKSRADATYLANELIGLVWADVPGRANYASAQCSAYARCSDWAAKVARTLPGGTSAVTVNAANGTVTIAISWSTQTGVQTYSTSTAVAA